MKQKGYSTSISLGVFVWLFSLQWHLCAGLTCPMGVSCKFENTNMCGWTSYYNGVGSPVNWDRNTQDSNGYARLNVKDKNGPFYSSLQSPSWVDPQPGNACQLTFRYSLGGIVANGTSDCGLSVIQAREGSGAQFTAWSTRQATGTASGFSTRTVELDCQTGTRYQIIFKGEVYGSGNNCGVSSEIAVDDVSCTATPTTPTTTTTRQTTGHENTTYSTLVSAGIGAGAIAGIAVAIGIASVVIVVAIVVRRRRGLGGKERGHSQHHYVNTAFGHNESTDEHHRNDHLDNSHPSNDRPAAAAYQNVEAPGAAIAAIAAAPPSDNQTYQNAENNMYEALATADVGLRNPYNVLPTQNTYETIARADSHVYKTLTNQNRDADGYEWVPNRKV